MPAQTHDGDAVQRGVGLTVSTAVEPMTVGLAGRGGDRVRAAQRSEGGLGAALRAGLDAASALSGHSLRRGFATETHRQGKNLLRIARHGGWKDGSTTLAGYIEDADQWEDNALTDVGL